MAEELWKVVLSTSYMDHLHEKNKNSLVFSDWGTFAQEIVTKKICFWVCCIVEFTFYSDGLMIHPPPFLNVIRMSMPTVSFLVLLDFGILYWQNVSLWFKMHLIFLIKTSFYMSKKSRQKCKYLKNEKRF